MKGQRYRHKGVSYEMKRHLNTMTYNIKATNKQYRNSYILMRDYLLY